MEPQGWEQAVDLLALRRWMDQERLGSGAIEGARELAGGTQNILLRFERNGRTFVLRRPPIHPRRNSNATMIREAQVLGALARTEVPHPRLIRACPHEQPLGAAFYLMESVDGFTATTGLPALHAKSEARRRRMGFALAEGAAAVAALDPVALGLSGLGRSDGYLERQVRRWKAQLDSYVAFPAWRGASDIPDVDDVAAWLVERTPKRFTPGLIHGDYHIANVMYRFDNSELAAIIDWELCTIGDPLIDLGWLLATWPDPAESTPTSVTPWKGFPTAAELVERYATLSQRNVTAINWYGVLACYKLGIILEGTHARASAGQAPRATGDLLHAKAVSLFERAHRFINSAPANLDA